MGKIIFYYLYELGKKGMNYFSGKKDYKDSIKKILDSISSNKQTVSDISKIVDASEELDGAAAEKILKLGYVQNLIKKSVDSKNSNLDETELRNELKSILVKSWSNLGNNAVDKLKKDLK
jgi:hypothetical protein